MKCGWAARRTDQYECAIVRFDPLTDAGKSRTTQLVGAASSIIRDLDVEVIIDEVYDHRRLMGIAMARNIGERFGDHEVGAGLNRCGTADTGSDLDARRHSRGGGEAGDGSAQATICQDWRKYAPNDVAKLAQRSFDSGLGLIKQLVGSVRISWELSSGRPDEHRRGDKGVLCAVMQRSLDASKFGGMSVERCGSGRGESGDSQG